MKTNDGILVPHLLQIQRTVHCDDLQGPPKEKCMTLIKTDSITYKSKVISVKTKLNGALLNPSHELVLFNDFYYYYYYFHFILRNSATL